MTDETQDATNQQETPASREDEQRDESSGAAATGAVVGGVAGAALGPVGAVAGAAAGAVLGSGVDNNSPDQAEADSAATGRGPSDERYGDPATDADWRNSDTGLSSAGATDTNADTSLVPSDQPGVRRGDTDTPQARRSLGRERSSIAGNEEDDETGRDTGPMALAEETNPRPNSGQDVGPLTTPDNDGGPDVLTPDERAGGSTTVGGAGIGSDVTPPTATGIGADVSPPSSPTPSSSHATLPPSGPDVSTGAGQHGTGGQLPQM